MNPVQAWSSQVFSHATIPAFVQLEAFFNLSHWTDWPNAQGLNQMKQAYQPGLAKSFACQSQFDPDAGYYEQIIYQQNKIPTRKENWHDLFNGLIWLQFPQTKQVLNRQHMEDIHRYGLSPRSKRRNQLTHFDECGLILACQDDLICQRLAAHDWQGAFVDMREAWHTEVQVFVFGHANLEMLLHPFIGLTGKWLVLTVEPDFKDFPQAEKLRQLDQQLALRLTRENLLAGDKPLRPIPLLGIPGYWAENRDPVFYRNTDYFRPKRTG